MHRFTSLTICAFSLAYDGGRDDFAKIVDIFDAHNASFVSVTQQFNTTTSMGRLTLNMLLSFAQFEREIAGERIRDKIAASKKKGMWMGGNVPLGYDVKDRKLIVNEPEASTVRLIFRRYAELGSVSLLRAELDRLGIVSKRREGAGGGLAGGQRFSRGAQPRPFAGASLFLRYIMPRGPKASSMPTASSGAASATVPSHWSRERSRALVGQARDSLASGSGRWTLLQPRKQAMARADPARAGLTSAARSTPANRPTRASSRNSILSMPSERLARPIS